MFSCQLFALQFTIALCKFCETSLVCLLWCVVVADNAAYSAFLQRKTPQNCTQKTDQLPSLPILGHTAGFPTSQQKQGRKTKDETGKKRKNTKKSANP